jgi:hypothetical protein
MKIDLLKLREAIEASWDTTTSYRNIVETGNPALGQCYPTSRVVQFFYPKTEIVEGEVLTPKGNEKHFWNVLEIDGVTHHIDLSWQQFPHGSHVIKYKIRDRNKFGDGSETTKRVDVLLNRVMKYLDAQT